MGIKEKVEGKCPWSLLMPANFYDVAGDLIHPFSVLRKEVITGQ